MGTFNADSPTTVRFLFARYVFAMHTNVPTAVELAKVAEVVAEMPAEVAEAAADMAAEAAAVSMAMFTRPTDEGRTDGCVAAGRAED